MKSPTIGRVLVRVAAIVLLLAGGTFFLQGIGLLPGSFMTGRGEWAVIGGAMVALAAVLMLWTAGTFRARPKG
jgi:hypothetical protein